MSFLQFPDTQVIKTLDTSEIVSLGAFTPARNTELKHARAQIYKHGTLAGNEQVRLNVYSRADLDGLLFSSDWADLADIDTTVPDYWLGLIRFDFARQSLDSNSAYTFAVATNNYTRNGDTFYLSFCYDVVGSQLVNTVSGGTAGILHIFGYEEKTL